MTREATRSARKLSVLLAVVAFLIAACDRRAGSKTVDASVNDAQDVDVTPMPVDGAHALEAAAPADAVFPAEDGSLAHDDASARPTPDAGLEIIYGGPICPKVGDTGCSKGLEHGNFGFLYLIKPPPSDGYVFPLDLQIVKRNPINLIREGANRLNETVLDVVSAPPPAAGKEIFLFSLYPPKAVLPESIPERLHYDFGGGKTTCAAGSLAGASEPITIGYASLSTEGGELLMGGASTVIRPMGVVDSASPEAWPFTLRWTDAGCLPCGPLGMRTAAIELTLRDETAPLFQALPGELKPLTLAGKEYLFRVSSALVSPDGAHYCGEGGWVLYRKDLVVELAEDGTVKTP